MTEMTELFLPDVLHTTTVDRVTPFAGTGDVDKIRAALGPLLRDRPGLAQHLANLRPPPWFSAITRNDVVVALGEVGNIWPRAIHAGLIIAEMEARGHGMPFALKAGPMGDFINI